MIDTGNGLGVDISPARNGSGYGCGRGGMAGSGYGTGGNSGSGTGPFSLPYSYEYGRVVGSGRNFQLARAITLDGCTTTNLIAFFGGTQ